jgi:hypothetical protein
MTGLQEFPVETEFGHVVVTGATLAPVRGLIGALVFFWHQAESFGQCLLAILKGSGLARFAGVRGVSRAPLI